MPAYSTRTTKKPGAASVRPGRGSLPMEEGRHPNYILQDMKALPIGLKYRRIIFAHLKLACHIAAMNSIG
uniref:Uncharacterized protein n=1 Tax=Nitrosospira lacus TaxID=1288494 RepID=A0A1W6SQ58_9PROT